MALERTLLELRTDIQLRLGFGMAGQAGVVNAPLIDSMLRSAQEQLYVQFDWAKLKAVQERSTGQAQQFYDYPADCNVERIQAIYLTWGGQLHQLEEGIDYQDRSTPSSTIPQKYERRDQIELWPVPQAIYPLRIEYIKQLGAFIANSDRATLPSEIVYLHALTNAKKHYRQPDADTYASQLESVLQRLKMSNRSRTVYRRRQGEMSPYDRRPDASQQV